jgi:hypothetical protein
MSARAQRTPYFDLPDYMDRDWLFGGSSRDERGALERGWAGTRIDALIGQAVAARIHTTYRSDAERDLHDHPWPSASVILRNQYIEVLPRSQDQDPDLDATQCSYRLRKPGDIVFRRARTRHRLIIVDNKPCVSLFLMFRFAPPTLEEIHKIQMAYLMAGLRAPDAADITRRWGFYAPGKGWVYWREYLNEWKRPVDDVLPLVAAA